MSFDREKSIFLAALDLPFGAERDAFVRAQCDGDEELRGAVKELLSAHDRSMNVLDHQTPQRMALQGQVKSAAEAIAQNATWDRGSDGSAIPPEGEDNSFIGNYVLLEKLGEGGFGQVYVAEQRHPVRRRVAIKLLKATAVTADALARFEAERQALAMMDHPNIARIFDGGTTSTGQPYFVMELVRGVHITEFCRNHELPVTQRLKLFLDVCHAVQHAHQKGIIHRDLKPSNVLITLHDAEAVVKVIDFGVAKALHEPLTDRTIYTRFAQMIGTPMYMSPEQAEMNSLDVDTRSDIYSLGVLLYELLTEQTPFDQHRLQTASFDEMRRMIREEDPPRPSARLTTTTRLITTREANRAVGERSLASELKGDLDWIVMKALEKDRRRRYETAADLARDVQRFLDQQPVVARPPSHWYRFTRFARRNRTVFASTVIVLLALVSGTIFSTWQAVRATIAQEEAERLRQEAVASVENLKRANVLLDSARANADEWRWELALQQYTEATELQPNHYLAWSGRGALLARLGDWPHAASNYATALELGAPANNPAWWGVPQLCYYAHETNAYDQVCQRMQEQLATTDDPGQVSMIVRGICIQPRDPDHIKAMAFRMEAYLFEESQNDRNRFGPPHPGHGPGGRPDGGPPGGPKGIPGERKPFPPGRDMREDILRYATGVANYRAGDSGRAIELLSEVRRGDERSPFGHMASAVLALAYHQQARDEDAIQELAVADKSVDMWLASMQASLEDPDYPWFDFVEMYVWYREAYQAITKRSPPVDPRFHELSHHVELILKSSEESSVQHRTANGQ
ncbi:serine/threonine protein kinase [Blastopirellula marina]|uniref:Serine/threonine protein kinase n=1 Tax=Blastopirellula marina TaxID=124 RepID=A0A2S8G9I9_9BACT|nr:serine/threonine-protein kinase [Blastopirellula marina]PQO41097.1 serine/threonine protein kinase [Blastopirellula marina]PTL45973.1 serine/threonine protein kinase [Blastopirellula marina]